MTQLSALWHVLLAMALGGGIGWERESADKPAGLRTHMLIAGAAALLVALGDVLVAHFGASQGSDLIRSDPIRIIQAIIAGVSFLGAGTIIRPAGGAKVEGLTTAASLLFSAAIGVAVALSQLLLAIGATALVLLTLIVLGRLEVATGKAEE